MRFGFVIHPIKAKDAARKFPIARYMPDWVIEKFYGAKKPFIGSFVDGIVSKTGATTEGWFIICPLTPDMMMKKMPLEAVYERIIQCTELAKSEGAELIGLGAFTSVVGDGGITVAKNSPIPVTTGNSYTVATAIQGAMMASELVGIIPAESTLAVVGATGSIGKTCARMLAPQFKNTIVVGRNTERTDAIAAELPRAESTVEVARIREADTIITVTSAGADIIFPEHLKPGAVIVDVSRPRDVSVKVAKERQDVLVIEGGVVRVPGPPNFRFNFGFPEGTAYACMSETMMLALEERAESFTLGKDVSVEQVQTTIDMAEKHGFTLDGFRAFEKSVGPVEIERARKARQMGA